MSNPKRVMTIAILAGLASAGAALYAATRVWSHTSHARPSPLPPETITQTGGQLAAWSVPAAVVGLAGVIALIATGGAARRVVTACVGLAGIGCVAAGGYGSVTDTGVWPVVTLIAGIAVLAVAVVAWQRGPSWPTMSARYDRAEAKPRAAVADDPAAMWDALDNGVDPTSLSIGETAPGEECAR
ncbi:MAG TPA: Trp biosynthesis-associated membrane protein [Stackebrandtia sp.]|jgi:hypothetical protein|uniref:Trp biosynthesis-associated membrane protein n=1 Tax=Stackebrandtia sp. TaxID=2023065 RepID=UPI002D73F433|nr:Trp biosynthesis-associated membrane protein [Stackebrandtia sp.]HZE41553.1 Trp biosynthesis-associated membrane protein [Stackebrandtia sp.]